MVAVWDEEITQLKEATVSSIHQLFQTTDTEAKIVIPIEVIEAATDCHLRPQEKNGKRKKRCLVCEANFHLKQYESKIFSTTQKDDDISNAGSWKPAPEEFMLRGKSIHSLNCFSSFSCVVDRPLLACLRAAVSMSAEGIVPSSLLFKLCYCSLISIVLL